MHLARQGLAHDPSVMEHMFETEVIKDGFWWPPGRWPFMTGAALLTNRTAGRISGLNPDV